MSEAAPARVVAFDPAVGWGWLEADDGRPLGFHCTQVADGSRDIAVGTAVCFAVRAGRDGAWEAADLRPAASA